MSLYRLSKNILTRIKESKISLEKDLQHIVEDNLEELFGLKFITSEFQLNNFRIDTLAFDEENGAFVIIEYKKDRSFSVVDQGYAYLSLLLNNKADFILEYNEKKKKILGRDQIDWSQSRVIFISQLFTKYQQEAIGFQDLPIELWEVKKYENDIIHLNQIKATDTQASIKTVSKNKDIEKVAKEIKQYSVEDHLRPNKDVELARDLFEQFSQRVLELDSNIEIRPVKSYIGFNLRNKVLVSVRIRSSRLLVDLNRTLPDQVNDPEKRVKYLENSYKYYNQHVCQAEINNEEDIDYVIMLVKQVYKKFTSQ